MSHLQALIFKNYQYILSYSFVMHKGIPIAIVRLRHKKQAAQRFVRQRFNLRKLNEPEAREHNQIEITNRFAALENLNDDKDINRTWENIK